MKNKINFDITSLFMPLTVKNKRLSNRIVLPPILTRLGITTKESVDWYGRRASGGVSLVIIGATSVNSFGKELTAKKLKPLVNTIHNGGALAAIQLFPVGVDQDISPIEIEKQEIERIILNFRVAAEICSEAGFDGIEPHGAHNYFLNQFFSPIQNKRSDEFGGEIENRMRFALNIVKEMRCICLDNMLILYRHSPEGEGYGLKESQIFVKELIYNGVDILDLSPSSIHYPGDKAIPFKKFGVPVIAVNELDEISRAVEVLENSRADLIGIGRGLIADPEWPKKVKEYRFDKIIRCTRCNEGCYGNIKKGIPIECVQWN